MPPLDQQTVGEIAASLPSAARVFHRHGIDFCCGGKRTLTDACRARGIDPRTVTLELLDEAREQPPLPRWEDRPVRDLIEHIVATHHRPLPGELDRLEHLARKVASVHGSARPEIELDGIVDSVLRLRGDLLPHLEKEEEILFPWILLGRQPPPAGPVEVMEAEHEAVGDLLAELRARTGDYHLPPGACASWTALWQGLEALETDLHQHIHLENNVLHPRALGG